MQREPEQLAFMPAAIYIYIRAKCAASERDTHLRAAFGQGYRVEQKPEGRVAYSLSLSLFLHSFPFFDVCRRVPETRVLDLGDSQLARIEVRNIGKEKCRA